MLTSPEECFLPQQSPTDDDVAPFPPASPGGRATSPVAQEESEMGGGRGGGGALSPLDYAELVGRAVGHEQEGLRELRRKAEEIGMVRADKPTRYKNN